MSRLYALYNDAKTRKEKRRESKKKYDDQTGCTFQPTLHKSSSRFNMKKSSMKNSQQALKSIFGYGLFIGCIYSLLLTPRLPED